MESIFIESTLFEKHRKDYLSDEDFRLLQAQLMYYPEQGDVIQGTGGLRKVRFAGKDKGKRGGFRIIYYYLSHYRRFYLLTIYAKNEMTDLTAAQKKLLREFMEKWIDEQS
ncbi:type II toxin-antitoxin system RelE/ParE family toxin [Paraneptunicella aestuarii]|uniref:type II toxin-antitoxin system RelE/ParE family toxin n=1 Tax=Paraneptunicella aestuarii TaxID=2831148 RepID=UPI001E596711|nr:type II toxin-antitoxin system RelE/ParE family toxin [Paraneptunicella aestuarii]UAA39314.1 type II toxin-antitoxin system RelE/ParE family toxin [Paraneptunicella aestuarii]